MATPDNGRRLSSSVPWDESDRPRGPVSDPSRTYSPTQQAVARHLVEVHDHLRRELEAVRGVVDQVLAGQVDARQARSELVKMSLRQNDWAMGAYCASYCRLVTTHHTIEGQSLFPHLVHAEPRLAPVVERLQAEHAVIHDIIESVDRALVTFIRAPAQSDQLRTTVDLLTDTLLSHLSYEESELLEPLAASGFY